MKWINERPTAPGWYWQRHLGDTPMVLCVVEWTGAGLVALDHIGNAVRVDDDWWTDCQWAGPIPEPED